MKDSCTFEPGPVGWATAFEAREAARAPARDRVPRARDLLARGADDLLARYELGALVAREMARDRKYGTRAVAALAASLGCSAVTLYRCARVASSFDRREFRRLLRLRGAALTWSHAVALAELPARAREAWIASVERPLVARDLFRARTDRP